MLQVSHQTRHIDQVIAVATGTHSDGKLIEDDLIRKSWARCVNDHGLDPTSARPARIIEHAQLREHQEQIESFQRVARAGMEQLFKRVSPLGYVLLLTDADGITVDYIGNEAWDRELKRAGLYLGADWNEVHAGTCGVGTCIFEREALTCHHDDHFDATHIGLTCTASPLFDPNGEFMGVLDVSALQSPEAKESQYLTRHMTVMYAQLVEDANFLRHFHNQWILRFGADWALVNVSGDLMVAFDRDGVIVGANRGARKALVAMSEGVIESNLIGRHLTDVFKTCLDEIWRLSRVGTTSDRSVLSTLRHELYYAMVVPPRPAASSGTAIPAASVSAPSLEYPALDKLAGEDAKMQRLIEQAKRLVNKNVNILLHGETGTGKEVIARALHDSSNRRKNTFVAVNCAAIPESLIESELFGYAAGSFTGGRTKGMRGLIQQSDGGTLFLDEIGDMPLHLQSRLLRVLSEREVLPIGGEKPIPIQLTVVAASHRDIRRLIADGVFREDLYYRLCGATLHLPPLRERGDKRYVISRVLGQEGVHMGVEASISGPAMSLLLAFEWPGNIRQLRNVIRFALAVCDDGYIDVPHLPQELGAEPQEPHFVTVMSAPVRHQRRREDSREAGFVTEMPFAQVNLVPNPALDPRVTELGAEGAQLFSVLRKHHWNITAVSSELNICRATVYRQMKRFAIVPPTHL
jgi:transcriptional regulator of acetoin/glycerol metabolism